MNARGAELLSLLPLLLLGCQVEGYCLDCAQATEVASSYLPDGGFGNADAAAFGSDGAAAGADSASGGAGGGGGACFASERGESCNGLDDDCDGLIDEDFDFATNPLHCGGCDRRCEGENAEAECREGECVITACLSGFADLDGQAGCEYRCPVFPTRDEDCNGQDDDCDGRVDETPQGAPSDLCRTTLGTPCETARPACLTRDGVTGWFCDYPDGVEFDPAIGNGIFSEETRCDGFDGDCDGLVDEPWPEVGSACDNGGVGACRDAGRWACDPDDVTATVCDLSVLPDPVPGAGPDATELCNAVDDNCDGIVDNSDPADPARIVDDMVHIARGALDFWIYRYEASRPDADAGDQGISAARACSRAAVQPWTQVAFEGARAACERAGLRLCRADEWLAACEGALARSYPYDDAYDPEICNGADSGAAALPAGARAECISEDGVADLSGNVKEWSDDPRGTTGAPEDKPIYVVRGGSFESPALGLSCQTELSQAIGDTLLPTLGFRCCSDAP